MANSVGVADPNPIYRRGLCQALKEQDLRVCEMEEGQLGAGMQVGALVVHAIGPHGRELIRDIRTRHPDTPIVAVVAPSWTRPPMHLAALTDGAVAAISEDAPPSVIASAVWAALMDWAVVVLPGKEIEAFSALFHEMLGDDPPMIDDDMLLLQRLFLGDTRQSLAEELHFARRTLDRRIEDLYRKLNASGRTDAIMRALLWGYLTGP